MPDLRIHSSIAERNDLAWHRRGWPLRRRVARWSLAAAALAGLLLVWWTWRGDERVYWSAPLSSSHAMLARDCRACHDQAGAPLMRMVTLDDGLPGVSDASCRKCHQQAAHDHHGNVMVRDKVRGCVDCHREHGHQAELATVSERHCTLCHANLETATGDSDFTRSIASFAEHPEFRFLRGEEVSTIVRWKKDAAAGESPWEDKTALRFNHRLHLAAEGMLLPWNEADGGEKSPARKRLVCHDCHQPDASGQAMQPIRYEQHCAACHKLEFSGKLAEGGPLPHAAADVVQGVLRERLLAYARKHPEELHGDEAPETPRLPSKAATPAGASEKEWEFVERELGGASSAVFRSIKLGCAHCHQVEEAAGASGLAFRVVPPRIPERWLPHSRFDHARHRELSCVACHDRDFALRRETGHALAGGGATELLSERTTDILMPSIQTCRACHSASGNTPGTAPARSDCTECHVYHEKSVGTQGKLDEWLRSSHLTP